MNASAMALGRAALMIFGLIWAVDLGLIVLRSREDLALFLICIGMAATAHALVLAGMARMQRQAQADNAARARIASVSSRGFFGWWRR